MVAFKGTICIVVRRRFSSVLFRLAVVSLLACLTLTCRADEPSLRSAPAGKGWNVFIVTIDTLRADRLPAYGYSSGATPAITRLAAEGTTFRWAFTPVPLTLPAHASVLTGMQPFRHGIRDNGAFYLDSQQRTLASMLKERGFRTAAFVSAFVLDSQWGLTTGFDRYYDDFNITADDLGAMASVQRPGGETWIEAQRWLEQQGNERFFVWLHLFDPHTPYAPPEPYRTQFAAQPYDGEIAYSDAIVGQAVDWLEKRSLLDKTVVVVLSDHGEGLGEHGEDEHGLLAYDSTLRVPWIVRLPGGQRAGTVIDREVSLVDVTPTILGLLSIPGSAPMDGTDLAPLLTSDTSVPAAEVYAESYYPRLRFNWSELLSVRNDQYKFIRAPRPELYDYRNDPGELRNLVTEQPEIAARLGSILDGMRRQANDVPVAKPVDAEAARRLASLGYVGGAPSLPSSADTLADPKDRVETYRSLVRARELLNSGDDRAGTRLLEKTVLGEPDLEPARRLLREYWLQRKLVGRGLDWFSAAARQHPDAVSLLIELGAFQRAAGRLDDAVVTFEKALARAPNSIDALSGAAETLREAGRLDHALELFKKAAAQSTDAVPTMRVAETLIRMGRLDEAEQILTSAIAANPKLGGAHYLLALVAEQHGDGTRAERDYRLEMGITPWDHRAPFNLAMLVGQRRDFQTQLALLESIPRIAPDFAEVHFFLAKALLDLGDRRRFPDAIAAARRGLQMAPESPQAALGHYVLADLYTLEGRAADAARELRLARQLEDSVSGARKRN